MKSAKRLLRTNTGPNGSLNHDRFIRALLQLRNTPDPDCDLSPAQILFGRPIRDSLSFVNRLEKYSNPHVRPMWREAWANKEEALRTRFTKSSEALNEHAKELPPLSVGDRCFIQNQTGRHPTKWHRTGSVVEAGRHDQYLIKVDGSGRLTKRNRRFLRAFKPASMSIDNTPLRDLGNTAHTVTDPYSDLCWEDPTETIPPTVLGPSNVTPYSLNAPELEVTPTASHAAEEQNLQNADPQKVPAMLKRLFPFNAPGKSEAIVPPGEGGRSRRRALNT